LVSEGVGRRVTRLLARNRTGINRASGALMLVVSTCYLLTAFDVFGVGSAFGVT
jgi:cytochrome c-type biogenesis protein